MIHVECSLDRALKGYSSTAAAHGHRGRPLSEVHEGVCRPGAVVSYRTLLLWNVPWGTTGCWRIIRLDNGELVDSLCVLAFRTSAELAVYLDGIIDGSAGEDPLPRRIAASVYDGAE